jgi:hypothetical protein
MAASKNRKRGLPGLKKNYEIFCDDRFDQWEQRFLLVELQNRNRF